jgi:addiction module RelB/DinJ family antitoxin
MTTVQIATRIDAEEKKIFEETARAIGLTPADALRVFIKAFDKEGGFPFVPNVSRGNEKYVPKYTPEQRKKIVKNHIKKLQSEGRVFEIKENENGVLTLPSEAMPEPELREAWVYERV